MRTIYSIGIYFYRLLIALYSLFDHKAKLWIEGRKNIFEKLENAIMHLKNSGAPVVWFHCASLGEFEQGRPLIEKYKSKFPDSKILLTFFSPSGYEIRKNYTGADLIFYLPLDTKKNAQRFLKIVNPSKAFFIKYEFWFNYLTELKERNVPVYLISGIFRPQQHFFKWYGSWFRKHLNAFTHFFLQNESSASLLKSIGYANVSVTGDTRFDRVSETVRSVKSIPLIEKFKQNYNILIAGSTWNEDEEILSSPDHPDYKLIIAPHEIDEAHIKSICARFPTRCLRYSEANDTNVNNAKVLVIDNIGMLSSLYQYGTIAFIGGGFGKGIHNILEASAFGLPVIFGPNYEKFEEAKELLKQGGAFSVSNKEEFLKIFEKLLNAQFLRTASQISIYYVESKVGASKRILEVIH